MNAEEKPKVLFSTVHTALSIALALNAIFIALVIYSATRGFRSHLPAEDRSHEAVQEMCSLPALKTGLRVGEAAGSPTLNSATGTGTTNNTSGSTLSSLTWGRYEVVHSYVMTVNYSHHNILIFQQQNGTQNYSTVRYYYQPALFLDVNKTAVAFNPFTQRHEVQLRVLMWNQAFEEYIGRKIREQTNVLNFVLSIIPIESIRLKPSGLTKQFQFVDRWVSYASQPQYVTFRLLCASDEICQEIASNIKEAPKAFIWDLRIHYSLEGQTSIGKTIAVKAEHVQQTSLYAAIDQKLPSKNPVFLTSNDANKLTTEISNNIQGIEIEDEDYLAEENGPTLIALINKALQFVSNSTENFDNATWNSVFWSDENARPDRVTQESNELFQQLDDESKSKFQQEVESKTSTGWQFEVGATFTKGKHSGSGAVGASQENTNEALSQKEVDKLNHLVKQARTKSIWKGEKFVPKPMEVKRMNTGNLKQGTQLATTQLRIKVATSQLTDAIKILDMDSAQKGADAPDAFVTKNAKNEVFLVKTTRSYILFTKAEADSICKVLNAQLASVEQVSDAWVAGGEWCHTGHTSTANVAAYPGSVCYKYRTDSSGSTLLPLMPDKVSCDSAAYYKKSFVYKTRDSQRFGANCWGLKPAKEEKLTYKNEQLVVMWFNDTHYSQHYQ